jgi:hypothetical protein
MSVRKKMILPFFALAIGIFLVNIVSAGAQGKLSKTVVKNVKKGTISGKIMIKDGGPLSGGQVIFFNAASGPPPEQERYDRTPDFVRNIDDDGKFSADIPEGKYYIGAVKRRSGETIGAPAEGDYTWRSLDEKGKPKAYAVEADKLLDIGTIAEAAPLKAESVVHRAVTTAIEGTVFDMDGKPVADAVVVAFINPSVQSKPLFISEKTGKDGKYLLRIAAGTFYLRVRNQFASGPPEPGQIVGYYGEGTPAPVTIKEGEKLKDIDFKVILFPGRGPFSGTNPANQ